MQEPAPINMSEQSGASGLCPSWSCECRVSPIGQVASCDSDSATSEAAGGSVSTAHADDAHKPSTCNRMRLESAKSATRKRKRSFMSYNLTGGWPRCNRKRLGSLKKRLRMWGSAGFVLEASESAKFSQWYGNTNCCTPSFRRCRALGRFPGPRARAPSMIRAGRTFSVQRGSADMIVILALERGAGSDRRYPPAAPALEQGPRTGGAGERPSEQLAFFQLRERDHVAPAGRRR